MANNDRDSKREKKQREKDQLNKEVPIIILLCMFVNMSNHDNYQGRNIT